MMLNDNISVFETFGGAPQTISLETWLKSCKEGCRYTNQVFKYRKYVNDLLAKGYSLDSVKNIMRELGKDKLKKSLPVVTVGAICEGGRKMNNVSTRTGWISLDIDGKDNPHIKDPESLRDEIAKIVYVAYSGLSTSGQGVWALVKVQMPEYQGEYFEQLKRDFQSRNIILDPSKGKNPNDARYYSYDPKAIIKKSFRIYDRLPLKRNSRSKPQKNKLIKKTFNQSNSTTSTQKDVEKLIDKIYSYRIDITSEYKEEWVSIGFALADKFEERGRDYFHQVSQWHPEYSAQDCDHQYSKCLKSKGSGVTIATFFHICKQYGITLDKQVTLNAHLKGKQI